MSHAVIKKKWVKSGKQTIWNSTLDNKGFLKRNITKHYIVTRGFRMGNTCIPVADSFWYMAQPTQYCKVK